MGIPKLNLSLNPIIIANTGRPFNIITGLDNNRDGIINDRPAFATDARRPCSGGQRLGITRPRRLALGRLRREPQAGQTIIPRNYGEGPGFFSVNMRIGRSFAFGDTEASRAAAARQQQQREQQRQGGNRGGGGDRTTTAGGPGGGGPRGGGRDEGRHGRRPHDDHDGRARRRRRREAATRSTSRSTSSTCSTTRTSASPSATCARPSFGQSLFTAGGFGGGGGNQAAGNRRVQASVRFSF